MSAIQIENEVRLCEACKTEKPNEDFYKIADKKRGTVRFERICKACKIQVSLKRKAKAQFNEATIQPPPQIEREQQQVPDPAIAQETTSKTKSEISSRQAKTYSHPNYEDWEVAKAIKVFQILLKVRDEGRKKGLINW